MSICGTINRSEVIKDVNLAGISDSDIRREALSTECRIISLVEGKYIERNATKHSLSISAVYSPSAVIKMTLYVRQQAILFVQKK